MHDVSWLADLCPPVIMRGKRCATFALQRRAHCRLAFSSRRGSFPPSVVRIRCARPAGQSLHRASCLLTAIVPDVSHGSMSEILRRRRGARVRTSRSSARFRVRRSYPPGTLSAFTNICRVVAHVHLIRCLRAAVRIISLRSAKRSERLSSPQPMPTESSCQTQGGIPRTKESEYSHAQC